MYFKNDTRPVYYDKYGTRRLANNLQWLGMLHFNYFEKINKHPSMFIPEDIKIKFQNRFGKDNILDKMIVKDLHDYLDSQN